MALHFLSDLHLEESRPEVVDAFVRYLGEQARGAEAVFILGDLFEAYVGDDDDSILNASIASALASLSSSGVSIHFQHGNRDFLLGDDYARACGMSLLGAAHDLDIAGARVLLAHGDALCTDDHAYQQFRLQSRNPAWQAHVLAQPLAVRRAMATQARQASAAHMATLSESIMDVNDGTVHAFMRAHAASLLVHGHTHRPRTHRFELDGRPVERVVLPAWHEAGGVLSVDDGAREMMVIPFR